MREDRVLVIIPVYNEGEGLYKVERDLRENFPEADLLFINDQSSDNSLEIIKSFKDVRYLNLPLNLGYFYAIQSGFKFALQHDYDYVVQFDGDGQHLATEAKKIYDAERKGGYDITIGSRFVKKTDYKHPFFRTIGTKLFRRMLKWMTGARIMDPTSGLQVLNRDVFTYLAQSYNYPEPADANLLMELLYKGFTIHEESVIMEYREGGGGMHGGIIKPAKYMIQMTFSMATIYLDHLMKGKRRDG